MDEPEVRALFDGSVARGAPLRNAACCPGEGPARRRRARLAWALLAFLTFFGAASARAGAGDDAAHALGQPSHGVLPRAVALSSAWSLPATPQLAVAAPPAPEVASTEHESSEEDARFEPVVLSAQAARVVRPLPAARARRFASAAWVAGRHGAAALPRGPPRGAR